MTAIRKLEGRPDTAAYRPLYRLGSGGMGEVWRGYSKRVLGVSRPCALKFLLREHERNPSYLKRFAREARIALDVSADHPNVVTTKELGVTSDGRLFLVMDLVLGPSLCAMGETLQGDLPRIRFVAEQLLLALGYLQAKRVIHGDVSPANILVAADGVVKLTDFGLARQQDQGECCKSELLFGTPAYASPEMLLDGDSGSHASDLYSLGAVLYELVVGQPPYGRGNVQTVARNLEAARKRNAVPEFPTSTKEDLQHLVRALLAWEPDNRIETEDALLLLYDSDESMETAEGLQHLVEPWVNEHPTQGLPGEAALSEAIRQYLDEHEVAASTDCEAVRTEKKRTRPRVGWRGVLLALGIVGIGVVGLHSVNPVKSSAVAVGRVAGQSTSPGAADAVQPTAESSDSVETRRTRAKSHAAGEAKKNKQREKHSERPQQFMPRNSREWEFYKVPRAGKAR